MAGTGTHIHRIIKKRFGEGLQASCKCEKWIKMLDRKGPAWARKHTRQIVAHLREEAGDRGWKRAIRTPGNRLALRGLVFIAIKRAERDQREGT